MAAWSAGNQHVSIIGDWHTHPNGDGRESATDRTAWNKLTGSIAGPGIGLIASPRGISAYAIRQMRWKLLVVPMDLVEVDGDDLVFAANWDAS